MSSPSIVQTRSLTRRSALGIVALALVMPSVSAFAQTPAILGACPGNGLGIKRSECQSALDWDPLSASKRDPFERRVRPVALAPSELAGVAETVRARGV
jgi:hypothetical protein